MMSCIDAASGQQITVLHVYLPDNVKFRHEYEDMWDRETLSHAEWLHEKRGCVRLALHKLWKRLTRQPTQFALHELEDTIKESKRRAHDREAHKKKHSRLVLDFTKLHDTRPIWDASSPDAAEAVKP